MMFILCFTKNITLGCNLQSYYTGCDQCLEPKFRSVSVYFTTKQVRLRSTISQREVLKLVGQK